MGAVLSDLRTLTQSNSPINYINMMVPTGNWQGYFLSRASRRRVNAELHCNDLR